MDQSVSKANIQVLDRASAILRVLTQHHDPVNLKVISDETCLHISTCHRILSDLVRLRFVEKGASAGTYRLGLRFLQLGNLVREESRFVIRQEPECSVCIISHARQSISQFVKTTISSISIVSCVSVRAFKSSVRSALLLPCIPRVQENSS